MARMINTPGDRLLPSSAIIRLLNEQRPEPVRLAEQLLGGRQGTGVAQEGPRR
ncbi:hypothetical protein [Amycolatopsis balhimycina]|uniref:hypothetical protein n=1 Tax=Amycolatopsis balhimycina TaxID=208443 RepID=UPI0012F9D777|nr:hypothetical protein [Amycolatopsis balhimycina]